MVFFSDIQNWLKADFGGRYAGKILLEWSKDDRKGFGRFISTLCERSGVVLPSTYILEEEFVYRTGRRADLAIFNNNQSLLPIVLIEIKWDDSLTINQDTAESQLSDYVKYCQKNNNCMLIVLTKNSLSFDELAQMKLLSGSCVHSYFGVLSDYLNSSPSNIARMFLEYLQDKGIVMNKIDSGVLFRFLHKFLNPHNGSGRVVSEDQLTNGPEQFKNVFNNLSLISQEISPAFFDVKKRNRKATIDFTVYPYFKVKHLAKLIKEAEDNDEDEISPESNMRTGGRIVVYATETLDVTPWVQIEYGFDFLIEPDNQHDLSVSAYALVRGAKIDADQTMVENEKAIIRKYLFDKSKKNELVSVFRNLIIDSVKNGMEKDVDLALKNQLKLVIKNIQF